MITKEQLSLLTGAVVTDSQGIECGTCTDVFVDDRTDLPAWAIVTTADGASCCAPLESASMDDGTVRLSWTKEQMTAAPTVSGRDEIDGELEARLRRHYGLDVGAGDAGTAPGMAPRSPGWNAEGDFATGMRGEREGEMAGAKPAGSPTESQARLQPDLGSNRPLERDLVEGGEGDIAPDATPGRHVEHAQGMEGRETHLRSWNSSMG